MTATPDIPSPIDAPADSGSDHRLVQRCKATIREHGLSWLDHPECGRMVTHITSSGVLICGYHAKQKGWRRSCPRPLNTERSHGANNG